MATTKKATTDEDSPEKRVEHYAKTYDVWSLARMLVEAEEREVKEKAKHTRFLRSLNPR